jgi:TPR repeat protein
MAKAIEWLQKAAAQQHTEALYDLGIMYRDGEGVTKDTMKAIELFKKAASQGHVKAQAILKM